MSSLNEENEKLNAALNDSDALAAYATPYDGYRTHAIPRALGNALVDLGDLIYGAEPSYLKFRALEVIARVPYHSWASGAYTLLTLVYTNEKRAMRLSKFSWFANFAQDNETMHVVVVSELSAKEEERSFGRGTVIPIIFAFVYFWVAYILYLFSARSAFELNYLFEDHAFRQYSRFLELHGDELKKKPMMSEYLEWYGRNCRSQFEFFRSLRNDELIHRNNSIRQIEAMQNNP